jgi:hypothetical protein
VRNRQKQAEEDEKDSGKAYVHYNDHSSVAETAGSQSKGNAWVFQAANPV